MEGLLHYCRCTEEISPERVRLGLMTCLVCGERVAQTEIKAKALRVAPDGNKQGYSYQGDRETARRNILQAGKKTESVLAGEVTAVQHLVTEPLKIRATPRNPRPRVVGVYYINGEARAWYADLADPRTVGATRWARLRK